MAIDTTKKAPPKGFKGFVKRHPIVTFFGALLLATLLYAGIGSLVDWHRLRALSGVIDGAENRIAAVMDTGVERGGGCGRNQGKLPGPLLCSEYIIVDFFADNEKDAVSEFYKIRTEIEAEDFTSENKHRLSESANPGGIYGQGEYRNAKGQCTTLYRFEGSLGKSKGQVIMTCDSTPWILEKIQLL